MDLARIMNAELAQATPKPAQKAQGSTQITGFDAVEGAPGPSTELKTFGSIYVVVWLALMAFIFLARKRHDALRAKVEGIEKRLEQIS